MQNWLSNKKILLGITGGIAAYKCADLIRKLKEKNADVRVILTENASRFITTDTIEVLSGNCVYHSLWKYEKNEGENEIPHIILSRWADIILIAPATAHFIAKLANGFADDLLTTIALATTSKMMIVPAMNKQMWENLATQENINRIQNRNIALLGPEIGIQACGEYGLGRMSEPETIIQELNCLFSPKYFTGKKIIVTAGPTQEPIDPVRYLSNHSSGKMGYAIAQAAQEAGADVTLISGTTSLTCSSMIQKIDVTTALEMREAVLINIIDCDIFISAAAVSDYRPKNVSASKLKKENEFQLELIKNPDILTEVANLSQRPITIGFAAETEALEVNAIKKLKQKNLDMIVANLVGADKGFNSDFNELLVIAKNHSQKISLDSKKNLSRILIKMIKEIFFKN